MHDFAACQMDRWLLQQAPSGSCVFVSDGFVSTDNGWLRTCRFERCTNCCNATLSCPSHSGMPMNHPQPWVRKEGWLPSTLQHMLRYFYSHLRWERVSHPTPVGQALGTRCEQLLQHINQPCTHTVPVTQPSHPVSASLTPTPETINDNLGFRKQHKPSTCPTQCAKALEYSV